MPGDPPRMSVILLVGGQRARSACALRSVIQQSTAAALDVLILDVGWRDHAPLDGCDHPSVRVLRLDRGIGFGAARARAILEAREPVVAFLEEHCVALPGWFSSVMLLARRIARSLRIPLIITPFWHLGRPTFLSPRSIVMPAVCRSAEAVIALTALERHRLIDHGIRPERCHVIPGGPVLGRAADPEGFRRHQGLGTAPMVLFLGRHWIPKGYRCMAAAAPLVWRHVPDTRFVFIGPTSGESIEFFRRCRDPGGRLLLLGEVSLEDKTSALAACDLLCVPSADESLGLVYLEAWAMGKPVIAGRIPVLETVVDDGVDGVLVDHDPTSVAAAICRLLGDPRQATSMGAAGAAKVKQRYQWSIAADRLSRLYAELIDSPVG